MQASFRLESRFDPDTGSTESAGRRPLFQGRSWVGMSGSLGTIRLGRDYTAMQDLIVEFDPFTFYSVATLDGACGSYSSDPSYSGSSGNRFSNGVYYNTPLMHGFQVYLTVASKEGLVGGPPLARHPVSFATTYLGGPLFLMVGAERSVAQDRFWNVSGSYRLGRVNLMSSYSKVTPLLVPRSTNKLIGADIYARQFDSFMQDDTAQDTRRTQALGRIQRGAAIAGAAIDAAEHALFQLGRAGGRRQAQQAELGCIDQARGQEEAGIDAHRQADKIMGELASPRLHRFVVAEQNDGFAVQGQ